LGEHRAGKIGSHTHRYRVHRLVYFETHSDIRIAIAREKAIKDWTREKRMLLIEERNAEWLDLGANW
jgi:putative endonuclease